MKKNLRLIWQLYPSYLVIIIVSLLSVALYSSSYIENFFLDKTKKDLIVRGKLLKNQISGLLTPLDESSLDALCKTIGSFSETRITVILPEGRVIGDSEKATDKMDNHRNRPEILTAIRGDIGSSIRDSETLRIRMMYVAMPLYHIQDSILAVLRVSLPVTSIQKTVESIQSRIMLVGCFVALLASVLSLFVSKWISRPIEQMKKGASRFASGDLAHRLHEPYIGEFAGLASSMNQMASDLEERIRTVKNQRNEYEAVLSSMSEGVIAIALDDKIININQAALDILKVRLLDVEDRSIQEVIRDTDFNRYVNKAALNNTSEEDDFILYNIGDRIINCLSAPLRNASDARIGTLIVLNDVTKIRQLENIRKDFVANVSHEIRTPLTAIKGFVETLFDMDDETTEDRKRFLHIILKHVDRLNSILEDLLSLARIENRDDEKGISLEEKNLRSVVVTALQIVQAKADEKKITIGLSVDEQITVNIDSHLVEQALVNLIDNAIKYSDKETAVEVTADVKDNELLISIRDHGPGIPEKHLSRIFERFYRVDQARSRALGGTGLGLSIVKHIAASHKGRVTVKSGPDKGSIFTIHFPEKLIVNRIVC